MKTNTLTVSDTKLTLEEQVELGRRMTLFGDEAAREKLILNCVPVVITAAKRFSNHLQASYDDLFQEGMMGVMEAIGKYDYTQNVKFTSFAYTRVIHKLVRWVKKQISASAGTAGQNDVDGKIVDSTIETFHSVFDSYPTDQQLSKLLSLSCDDIEYLRKHHSNPVPLTYRACPHEASPADSYLIDASSVVEKMMCNEYNRRYLFDAIQTLDALEREIVLRRYLRDEDKATLAELAAEHNVNVSTVSRRERKALGNILLYFKEIGFQPEF